MPEFCHLHCHTQFSLLDGATDVSAMMRKAHEDGMKAVAMTDHGNMFGCFSFVKEAKKQKIKPILGCEFYLVPDRHKHSFVKSAGEKDERYHQLLLAKNQEGYINLSKLCSLGFIEGMYGKFPRIDKELIQRHHKGLIATSCCIGAEIPQAIIRGDNEEAERLLKWWLDLLGEDFYIEIQRQNGNDNIDGAGIAQEDVNQKLLALAKKYNVKVIATNDVHYLQEDDALPHDVLLCINTNSFVDEPDRFRFSSTEYFFKTQGQMQERFADLPAALDQTLEIADKCFTPNLERDILLPAFPIPPEFENQYSYIRHLVMEGARDRYGNITDIVKSRLEYELEIIHSMGFVGYFLIVQDFCHAARRLGVGVGPGRGSAAGSAVAYCLTITDIDPIKYNLLFERFLNPERVSMPDIDIDFDDRGRDKVLNYVVEKYGRNQVAQIVTFGTMAAKSSIRDVARVKRLDLGSASRLAQMVPTRPGVYLRDLLNLEKAISDDFTSDDKARVQDLRKVFQGDNLEAEVLRTALQLEGSVKSTGVHASAVIIAPDDITNYIPVSTAKDADLWVTQVEGSVIEATGLLKMDFLGLATLSIIENTLNNIRKRQGKDFNLDIKEIPLDDPKTLELFQEGATIGIFQFESEGMRGHLRNLKPGNIEDIIAMNALFRPGPMSNIDEFIARKWGRIPVQYPHENLAELLSPTYGIMVYQEQIMLVAQIMADYSLGEADMLRRAMGKKKKEEMDKHRSIFTERAVAKGIQLDNANQIFDTMAKFAEYGFNRSHAAAYSILAFQTAYLKAHYPAEFMSAVLTANKGTIDNLKFYLQECGRMKTKVLGPDINESDMDFTVNKSGEIRFGLSALKGVGEGPVVEIIRERDLNGHFSDFTEILKRLGSNINKKILESCVMGGAFDSFNQIHRAQYFAPFDKFGSYIEYMVRWATQYQNSLKNTGGSLFGETEFEDIKAPLPPDAEVWNTIEKLEKEMSVAGIYLSGHPLDDYEYEVKYAANANIEILTGWQNAGAPERKVKLAGFVSNVSHKTNKAGEGFGSFVLQDHHGAIPVFLFKENYRNFKNLLDPGICVFVEGTYGKDTWRQNESEYQLRIEKISLLSSALEQSVKKINIFINIRSLNEIFLQKLTKHFKQYSDKLVPRIVFLDTEQELKLNYLGIKTKVQISPDFLKGLDNLGVSYVINP